MVLTREGGIERKRTVSALKYEPGTTRRVVRRVID